MKLAVLVTCFHAVKAHYGLTLLLVLRETLRSDLSAFFDLELIRLFFFSLFFFFEEVVIEIL